MTGLLDDPWRRECVRCGSQGVTARYRSESDDHVADCRNPSCLHTGPKVTDVKTGETVAL